MRIFALLTAACTLGSLSSAFVACGSAFSDAGGSDAGGDARTTDATTPDGPSTDASAGETGGDAVALDATGSEGSADGAAGKVIYVSTLGDDTHAGTDPAQPKRTIASALSTTNAHPGAYTVEVCAGTYSEAKLTVSADVLLRGGYDCKAWSRTAAYGYPTFDGVNTTTITDADPVGQSAALVVSGSVTSATAIDGFFVQGPSASGAVSIPSFGIHVVGSAAPVISNDEINGGAGQGGTTGIGSHGVFVEGASAPEIKQSIVYGGTGAGTEGSVGVYLDTTGAVNLHDSIVSGGTGTSTLTSSGGLSSVGIVVHTSLASSLPLSSLLVSATGGQGTAGNTAGVYVDGAGVSAGISDCVIVGGFGATPQSYSAGVLVNASGGTVTVVDDRIYGGSSAGPSSQTYGVLVRAAGTLLIGNVMVHAGTVANAVGSYTVGVDLSSVASPAVVDTTIYTGSAAGTAIALNPGVTSAVVTDDILLGSDSPLGTFGVAATSCSGLLAVFSYSGLANLAVLYQCTAGDGGVLQATTPVALVAALGTTAAAGDVVLQSVCTVPGCAVVPGCPQPGEGCPTALFEPTWSATDDGVCSLLGSCAADSGVPTDGWTLAAGSPCAVTRGGAPIPNVTTDIYGNARSAKTPTMGAAEYGNATACK